MNKIKTSMLVAAVLATGGLANAKTAGVGTKEYLTLNKQMLPPMQVVIQSSLDVSDMEPISLVAMKKRARRSAFLPRLRLKMDYDLDAVDQWGYVEDARLFTTIEGTKMDKWERVGSEDRLSYGAFAEWDLSVFIWEKFDHLLAEKYAKQGGLKRRRIVEVSKRYAILQVLLPEDESGSVAAADLADVLDNAIYLDLVTDYLLSSTIRRAKQEEEAAMMEVDMDEEAKVVEPVEEPRPEPAAETKETVSSGNTDKASDQEKNEMLDFIHSL